MDNAIFTATPDWLTFLSLVLKTIPDWLATIILALSILLFIIYIPLASSVRFERCRKCKGSNPIEVPVCAHCGESTQVMRASPFMGIIFLIVFFSILAFMIALVSALPYPDPPWDKLAVSGAGLLVLILAAVLSTWARKRGTRLKQLFILQKKDFYGGFCGNCGTEILGGNQVCPNCGQVVTLEPPNWTTNPAVGSPQTADPHILCRKCKSVNATATTRCVQCRHDLLVYKPVWERVLYFVLSILFSIGSGWLAYKVYQNPDLEEVLSFLGASLLFLVLFTIIMPFYGLYLALGKGTPHELLVERANRHLKDHPWQALIDYSLALEIAPAPTHRKILTSRMNLFTTLGLEQNAIRDELAITYASENNPEGGVGLYLGDTFIGGMGPSGSFERGYLSGIRRQARKAREKMFHDGKVIALGWCPACNCIMELNDSLRCPNPDNMQRHPGKPKFIQYVVSADIQAGRDAIPRLMEAAKKKSSRRIVSIVLVIIIISGLCWLSYWFANL